MIAIGGNQNTKLQHLILNDDEEMSWKQLNKMELRGSRRNPVFFSSSVLIDDDTLFNCGGGRNISFNNTNEKNTYLGNIEKNEWKELSALENGRDNMGIYYDDSNAKRRIYVAGGDCGGYSSNLSSLADYYDPTKNEWYRLPNLNNKHRNRPVIWMDDLGLLYVTSVSSNEIEYIDLRENDSKWKWHSLLETKFTTKICSKKSLSN